MSHTQYSVAQPVNPTIQILITTRGNPTFSPGVFSIQWNINKFKLSQDIDSTMYIRLIINSSKPDELYMVEEDGEESATGEAWQVS